MTPEFSRSLRLDTIGAGERRIAIVADADERRALAGRFRLLAIERLAATVAVRRDAAGVLASGHLSGAVVQACSVTGDPVPAGLVNVFATERDRYFELLLKPTSARANNN